MSGDKSTAHIEFEQIKLNEANQKRLAEIALQNTPPEEVHKQQVWKGELSKLLEDRKRYGNFFYLINKGKQTAAALFTEPVTLRDETMALVMLNKDGLQVIKGVGRKTNTIWPFTLNDRGLKSVPDTNNALKEHDIGAGNDLLFFLLTTQHNDDEACDSPLCYSISTYRYILHYDDPEHPWYKNMLFFEEPIDGKDEYYMYKPLRDPKIAHEAYMKSIEETSKHVFLHEWWK